MTNKDKKKDLVGSYAEYSDLYGIRTVKVVAVTRDGTKAHIVSLRFMQEVMDRHRRQSAKTRPQVDAWVTLDRLIQVRDTVLTEESFNAQTIESR